MQDFTNEWLGKRVDFDHINLYQCVDLIKQYLYEDFGIPNGKFGNAVDYWYKTAPVILTKFDRIQTADVVAGDVVPLAGVNGNPYGHVGIATGVQDANTVEILEQNGHNGSGDGLGGNAIRKRSVPKSRVLGVLRPKLQVPPHTEKVKPGTWNVRVKPDMSGRILGIVHGGEGYITIIVTAGWRQINFNGQVGYVGPAAWAQGA